MILRKILSSLLIVSLSWTQIIPLFAAQAWAQSALTLPVPGVMLNPSVGFQPAVLAGLQVDVDNPFRFEFIADTGDDELSADELNPELSRLIRYFMAALTVPDEDLWVNLSPAEENRIIPEAFGQTEMGRDLLAQDYLLKQSTASLIYPEDDLGKAFWNRVYSRAQELYGTTDIPVNTFNKVWIVPDEVGIYENEDGVYITDSRMKVMLEMDYLAQKNEIGVDSSNADQLSSEMIREIIIPAIEQEVNEGENFAILRQIYQSLILATWYKNNLKDSLLVKAYADQNKTFGVDVDDKDIKNKIYDQYTEAFRKGVYDYIREDYDAVTDEVIPRKYFSGGENFKGAHQLTRQTSQPSRGSWLDMRRRNSSSPMSQVAVRMDMPAASSQILNQAKQDLSQLLDSNVLLRHTQLL